MRRSPCSPDGRPGVQLDSRLTFGWVTTKEKIIKNSGWTVEIHLESARVNLKSCQNMWRSVKSSPTIMTMKSWVLISKQLFFTLSWLLIYLANRSLAFLKPILIQFFICWLHYMVFFNLLMSFICSYWRLWCVLDWCTVKSTMPSLLVNGHLHLILLSLCLPMVNLSCFSFLCTLTMVWLPPVQFPYTIGSLWSCARKLKWLILDKLLFILALESFRITLVAS